MKYLIQRKKLCIYQSWSRYIIGSNYKSFQSNYMPNEYNLNTTFYCINFYCNNNNIDNYKKIYKEFSYIADYIPRLYKFILKDAFCPIFTPGLLRKNLNSFIVFNINGGDFLVVFYKLLIILSSKISLQEIRQSARCRPIAAYALRAWADSCGDGMPVIC